MKRNTILKTISTLLLISTFLLFQACETDIQGVGSDLGDPVLINQYNQAVRNLKTYNEAIHTRLISRANNNSLASRSGNEEDKELLLKLFLREFESEESFYSFANRNGYPVFDLAVLPGEGMFKELAIVPILKNGYVAGYIHYVLNSNSSEGEKMNFAFVDYLTEEVVERYFQRAIHNELDDVFNDYMKLIIGSQQILSLSIGNQLSDERMEYLSEMSNVNNSELTSRTECPDGSIPLTITEYLPYNPLAGNGMTGGSSSPCPCPSPWAPTVLCAQVYGGSGTGEGPGGFGSDGPTVPWGFINEGGFTGGSSDPGRQGTNPSGCGDFSAPDTGNGDDEFGNGGIGGGEPPETNPREEAQLTAEIDAIFESIPGLDPSVQYCLRNSASMRETAQEMADKYEGLVNCAGSSALDGIARILRVGCVNGCEGVMNESLGELEEEEWIDREAILSSSEFNFTEDQMTQIMSSRILCDPYDSWEDAAFASLIDDLCMSPIETEEPCELSSDYSIPDGWILCSSFEYTPIGSSSGQMACVKDLKFAINGIPSQPYCLCMTLPISRFNTPNEIITPGNAAECTAYAINSSAKAAEFLYRAQRPSDFVINWALYMKFFKVVFTVKMATTECGYGTVATCASTPAGPIPTDPIFVTEWWHHLAFLGSGCD